MAFRLSHGSLLPPTLLDTAAGGHVTFEGKVRDHHKGRKVVALEYEAYEELAMAEGEALLKEATDRFGLQQAQVEHRLGLLPLGETAVCIAVAAAHRREAFAACEFIIDEIKQRVPIWKKEHYADGDSGWVSTHEPREGDASDLYHELQGFPEMGIDGRERLARSAVLVVGAGSLGSAVFPSLAGAGVGTIGILEPSSVKRAELHRQTVYGYDEEGRSKAERAAAFVQRLNPFVKAQAFVESLTEVNAHRFVAEFDVIVDATNRPEVNEHLNDACVHADKTLVSARVGHLHGRLLKVAHNGPCLRCHPGHGPTDTRAAWGPAAGVIGLLAAHETLFSLLGRPSPLDGHVLEYDLQTLASNLVPLHKDPGCFVCGAGPAPSATRQDG